MAGVGVYFNKSGYEHLRATLIDRVDFEEEDEELCARQLKNRKYSGKTNLGCLRKMERGLNTFI